MSELVTDEIVHDAAKAAYAAYPLTRYVGPVAMGPVPWDELPLEEILRRREDTRAALEAAAPLIAARALEGARKELQAAYKTEVPRALLSDGQQAAWRIGISRAHGIVRDYQRRLTATTEEPT